MDRFGGGKKVIWRIHVLFYKTYLTDNHFRFLNLVCGNSLSVKKKRPHPYVKKWKIKLQKNNKASWWKSEIKEAILQKLAKYQENGSKTKNIEKKSIETQLYLKSSELTS